MICVGVWGQVGYKKRRGRERGKTSVRHAEFVGLVADFGEDTVMGEKY